jgi:GntR family transcriptional regulator, transcriptional repressor for pyruvate dehydrogenase complex
MTRDIFFEQSGLAIQKVNREALSEQVVEQLQQLVFDRHLKTGDRLPGERELCEKFGVSRTVIREATRIMAQRGILIIQPGRGTYVTLPSQENIALAIELFARATNTPMASLVELRRALEPEIAALAASRVNSEHLQRLQVCIDEMDRCIEDPDGYIRADHGFHSTLAEATGNPLFIAISSVIVNLAQSARKKMFEVDGAPERGQDYHRRILKFVSEGDCAKARSEMLNHLIQVDHDVSKAEEVAKNRGSQ